MEIKIEEIEKDIKDRKETLVKLKNSYNMLIEAIAKIQGQIELLVDLKNKATEK